MPIQNLNGGMRKNGRIVTGGTHVKNAFGNNLSDEQHQHSLVVGNDYNTNVSGNTSKAPLANMTNTATIATVPALQMEQAGQVAPTGEYVKVHPHEKGSTLKPSTMLTSIKLTTFQPSKQNDTAASPNQRKQLPSRHPLRPHVPTEKYNTNTGSFLSTTSHTLGGHVNADTDDSRWLTIKTGAAG
jgi:hypothetical protein